MDEPAAPTLDLTVDHALDRALGALYGLAVGDALGMPTQTLSRRRVTELFGDLDGFRAGPAENEVSAGLPAGRVTDDTDQAVIVAELLVEGHGTVDPEAMARGCWPGRTRWCAAGSADLLGPSTLRALRLVADGAPRDDGALGRHERRRHAGDPGRHRRGTGAARPVAAPPWPTSTG